MLINIEGICQFDKCDKTATHIASGREQYPNPGFYCEDHALVVADEGHPEYHDECPNCGCRFGVN